MPKGKRGPDTRHRDKRGRIDLKHGNTKVAALRKEYGASFAKGRRKDLMLKTCSGKPGARRCTNICGASQIAARRFFCRSVAA
jgi:hypothetical protein